jgi:hypothetical protein
MKYDFLGFVKRADPAPDGARDWLSGIRPNLLMPSGYLTSCMIEFTDPERLKPTEGCECLAKTISPEHYPHQLYSGIILNVQIASRIIGTMRVIEIYNEVLKVDNNDRGQKSNN